MRRSIKIGLLFAATWAAAGPAPAQNTGAKQSGNWNDPAIWTGGAVPGSSNTVFIGGAGPFGTAVAATVTLQADASAASVSLGDNNVDANASGTLNLNGYTLTVGGLSIGLGTGSGGVGVLNEGTGGSFTANDLYVYGSNSLALGTNDVVGSVNLSNGASVQTSATGNITGGTQGIQAQAGSTLTLGADLSVGNNTMSFYASTLNLNGNSITSDYLYLNGSTFDRGTTPGTLTLNGLGVTSGEQLNLIQGDLIRYNVSIEDTGTTLTTATSQNIASTSDVDVSLGAKLVLGANLDLGQSQLFVSDTGSTVDMMGHNITAGTLSLGYIGTSAVTLDRGTTPGTLSVVNLDMASGQTLNLIQGDSITSFMISGAGTTLTTATSQNIVGGLGTGDGVELGARLVLGANLNLAGGTLGIDSGSTLDMEGHAIAGGSLELGSSSAGTVLNPGAFNLVTLQMSNGTELTMHGGDSVSSAIVLNGGSVLTVDEVNDQGLTFYGSAAGDLTIDPSTMDLVFTSTAAGNWDFAWKDPSSTTNWISTLTTMIDDGEIKLTLLPGQTYSIVNMGGYTYIEGVGGTSVPEPSSLVLACTAAGGGRARDVVAATPWPLTRGGTPEAPAARDVAVAGAIVVTGQRAVAGRSRVLRKSGSGGPLYEAAPSADLLFSPR
jgi:fibronectin-binding autotransporter adhesin